MRDHTFTVHGFVAEILEGHEPSVKQLVVAVGDERATIRVSQELWDTNAYMLQVGHRVVIRGKTDIGPMGSAAINEATELELLPPLLVAGPH